MTKLAITVDTNESGTLYFKCATPEEARILLDYLEGYEIPDGSVHPTGEPVQIMKTPYVYFFKPKDIRDSDILAKLNKLGVSTKRTINGNGDYETHFNSKEITRKKIQVELPSPVPQRITIKMYVNKIPQLGFESDDSYASFTFCLDFTSSEIAKNNYDSLMEKLGITIGTTGAPILNDKTISFPVEIQTLDGTPYIKFQTQQQIPENLVEFLRIHHRDIGGGVNTVHENDNSFCAKTFYPQARYLTLETGRNHPLTERASASSKNNNNSSNTHIRDEQQPSSLEEEFETLKKLVQTQQETFEALKKLVQTQRPDIAAIKTAIQSLETHPASIQKDINTQKVALLKALTESPILTAQLFRDILAIKKQADLKPAVVKVVKQLDIIQNAREHQGYLSDQGRHDKIGSIINTLNSIAAPTSTSISSARNSNNNEIQNNNTLFSLAELEPNTDIAQRDKNEMKLTISITSDFEFLIECKNDKDAKELLDYFMGEDIFFDLAGREEPLIARYSGHSNKASNCIYIKPSHRDANNILCFDKQDDALFALKNKINTLLNDNPAFTIQDNGRIYVTLNQSQIFQNGETTKEVMVDRSHLKNSRHRITTQLHLLDKNGELNFCLQFASYAIAENFYDSFRAQQISPANNHKPRLLNNGVISFPCTPIQQDEKCAIQFKTHDVAEILTKLIPNLEIITGGNVKNPNVGNANILWVTKLANRSQPVFYSFYDSSISMAAPQSQSNNNNNNSSLSNVPVIQERFKQLQQIAKSKNTNVATIKEAIHLLTQEKSSITSDYELPSINTQKISLLEILAESPLFAPKLITSILAIKKQEDVAETIAEIKTWLTKADDSPKHKAYLDMDKQVKIDNAITSLDQLAHDVSPLNPKNYIKQQILVLQDIIKLKKDSQENKKKGFWHKNTDDLQKEIDTGETLKTELDRLLNDADLTSVNLVRKLVETYINTTTKHEGGFDKSISSGKAKYFTVARPKSKLKTFHDELVHGGEQLTQAAERLSASNRQRS